MTQIQPFCYDECAPTIFKVLCIGFELHSAFAASEERVTCRTALLLIAMLHFAPKQVGRGVRRSITGVGAKTYCSSIGDSRGVVSVERNPLLHAQIELVGYDSWLH